MLFDWLFGGDSEETSEEQSFSDYGSSSSGPEPQPEPDPEPDPEPPDPSIPEHDY